MMPQSTSAAEGMSIMKEETTIMFFVYWIFLQDSYATENVYFLI